MPSETQVSPAEALMLVNCQVALRKIKALGLRVDPALVDRYRERARQELLEVLRGRTRRLSQPQTLWEAIQSG